MEKIDLSILRNYQQLPKVYIKPIKALKDRIYFLKYMSSDKYNRYLEGIYCFYKADKRIIQVDSGFHTKDPKRFYLFMPQSDEDILSFSHMNYIVFSIIVRYRDERDMAHIILYAVDVEKNRQLEVFSIKYNLNEFMYSGFRMLSDTYALIELGNKHSEEEKELDKLFLINIYDSQIDEIHDNYTKYTVGFMCMDQKSENFFVEETYMDEEHEYNVITSDMYEINTQEIQKSLINPFQNSIKTYDLKEFLEKARLKGKRVEPKYLDMTGDIGVLRVIGTTDDFIYYKKTFDDNVLKNSNKFEDRLLMGKSEIYSINKNTKEVIKIARIDRENVFCFRDDNLLKISQDKSGITVHQISDGKQIYQYKKENHFEKYFDFISNRYLIIRTKDKNKDFFKVIDTNTGKVELECKEVMFLDGVLFYES